MATTQIPPPPPRPAAEAYPETDSLDLLDSLRRVRRGLLQIVGLGLLGMVIAAAIFLLNNRTASISTSTRVTFAFKGFERGLYPDNSKFQPDDLRSPDVVLDAIKRMNGIILERQQADIRTALVVEGVIAAEVTKQRDRMRSAGQIPAVYVPDEYILTISLPRNFPLGEQHRSQLLMEIVNAYRDKFRRTYESTPKGFGNVFESLRNADYLEYEFVLNEEIRNITHYLAQHLETDKTFRSPTTSLSYSDLMKHVATFEQIKVLETLGQVQVNGFSKDRRLAMIKMDYYLHTLEDRERQALAEEEVVQGLLTKAQDHAQSYVLGIKSQIGQNRSDSVIDQGLIDSLIANDSYNFLIRRALDAGLQVKRIQAQKALLQERRKSLQTFSTDQTTDQSIITAHIGKSLRELEISYHELIDNIRKTQDDFNRQQFADAIRITASVNTGSLMRKLVIFSGVGLLLGAMTGVAMALLGVYMDFRRQT